MHVAVVCGAPYKVLEALIKLYPAALRCTDDQHMLPFHLALRHGAPDDVLAMMLEEFPEAVNAKGKNGRTAIDCALKCEDKSRGRMLQVFIERTKSRLNKAVMKDRTALKAIIEKTNDENEALKTELENQLAVAEKLRSDLAKAQVEVELAYAAKRQAENKLQGKNIDAGISRSPSESSGFASMVAKSLSFL